MATERKPPPPLTTRLQRLLALDGPFFGRPRPTAAEMESLLAVLAEGSRAADRVHVGRAMQIAADNAPDERTANLIARVLHDAAAPPALRLQAAASLGEIPLRTAGKALAEALSRSDAGLEATLLQSLAKVGDLDAEPLILQRPAATPRLAQLRAFARAAILLRAGRPLDAAASDAVLPVGVAIEVGAEPPQAVAAVLARWRGARYGVQLAPELGWRLRAPCGDQLLLLAAQMAAGRRLAWLAGGERIAGVVAVRETGDEGDYAAQRLVLTQPTAAGLRVSVVRLDGEVDLLGHLGAAREGYALTLRSTGRAGLPLAVDGMVSDDALRLRVHAFPAQRARKRSGAVEPVVL